MNTPTLTISPVQQEDEDEYYCVASNNIKDESRTAVVAVLSNTTGTIISLGTINLLLYVINSGQI